MDTEQSEIQANAPASFNGRNRVGRDHDLVESGNDVTAGEPLELLAGLQQQAAGGHLDIHLGAVAQPRVEARVPRATVNRQKVEVVMVGSKHCVHGAVLDEVGRGRREQVRAKLGECDDARGVWRKATRRASCEAT